MQRKIDMPTGKKWSVEKVREVKYLICRGYSQVYVARETGVSKGVVNNICAERVHKDIPWPCTPSEAQYHRELKELFPDG